MAYPEDEYSSDIDYIKRYGDNPNAPGAAVVNAVDRAAPVNPTRDFLNRAAVQGAPAGGTLPASDPTNLNIAAAMERADLAGRIVQPQEAATTAAPLPTVASIAMDEYGQHRQEIDKQRAQIMARLGIIPPQQAGWSAVVLASPHERVGLLQNLSALEEQSNRALREHHYAAMENAQQLHQQTALQTGIQVGTGKAKILQTIQDANQRHGVGTPAARDAILSAAGSDDPDIRAALGHKALDTILKPYTDMHDLAARRREFVQAFGREPTSVETTATGGINLRAGEEKVTAAEKELKPYGISEEQIQNAIGARVGKVTTDEKGNPVFKPTYEGDVVELAGKVSQGGKTHIARIPLETYQKYGGKVAAPPAAPAAPGSTPEGQNAPTIPATVPAVADRKAGATYPTPRGPLKWTGTGWTTP